jgi:translation initiation factor IF-3
MSVLVGIGSCFEQGFSVPWSRMPSAWGTPEDNIGGPISTETRVNERIRVPEVRLIGPGGEQVGIVRIEDALRVAADADLDLVEVAPDAKPPVCKIMDYGKFKYETAQKARESRKNQQQTVVKEQKLRPKIDPHDYQTKKGHVIRFLEAGSKVKVTIMFRGREQSRPELGYRLLQRLGADVADYGFVETSAKQDGRNMTMVLAPHRGAKTRAKAAHDADEPLARRAAGTDEPLARRAASTDAPAAGRRPAAEAQPTDTPATNTQQN